MIKKVNTIVKMCDIVVRVQSTTPRFVIESKKMIFHFSTSTPTNTMVVDPETNEAMVLQLHHMVDRHRIESVWLELRLTTKEFKHARLQLELDPMPTSASWQN